MQASNDSDLLLSHAGWVRGLARALVRDADEAEELTQETLVRAWRNGPRATERDGHGTRRPWLARVLRNVLAERRRSGARRAEREQASARPEAEPSVLDGLARLAMHKQVVLAVEALDEPFRTTVILRWFDELPPRAIARRMDVPVRTVNSRLERAHARLRERLRAEHGGDRDRMLRVLALLADGDGLETSVVRRIAARAGPRLAFVAAAGLVLVVILATRASWSPSSASTTPAAALGSNGTERARNALDAGEWGAGGSSRSPAARVHVVRGRVLDATNAPIVGAKLELVRSDAGGLELPRGIVAVEERVDGHATSDVRGEWSLATEAGPLFTLTTHAPGFALERIDGVVADEVLDVRLEHAATLVVHVHDRQGAPCARAQVVVHGAGRSTPLAAGVTDGDGAWSTEALPSGAWTVSARSGVGPSDANVEVRARAGERIERRLELGLGVVRAGIVVRKADGAPIAGAVIALVDDGREGARSGPDGCFTLREPEGGGAYDLCARAPGFASVIQHANDGSNANEAELRFELARGAVIEGRVVDERGAGVASAWVLAWSRRRSAFRTEWDARAACTDATGAFTIPDARTDLDYALVARANGCASVERIVCAAAVRSGVELALTPEARIVGGVRAFDGRPIAGAEVFVRRVDGVSGAREEAAATTVAISIGASARAEDGALDLEPLRTQRTTTRADGTFRVAGLAPGRHRVWARTASTGVVAEREIEIEAGARIEDVELALAAGGALGVRVVDPDGAPIVGAWALLFRGDERLELRSTPVGGDGRVRFEGLAPARYRVSVLHHATVVNGRADRPFASGETRDLAPDGGETELVLRRNRTLAGTVVDARGRALAGARVDAQSASGATDQAHTGADGRFVVQLPEGEPITLEVGFVEASKRWVGRAADAQDGVVVELH
ncbi:MAG: sigma-70 family RNA polymerase sigma factor [Planctomycetes bacterium]|nr:sigma-70 family RNA polymerase sigma factor [Planctomycetota bacterium]